MTTSESTKAVSALPGDLTHTIRRYLGNRRLLLAAAILALVAGAALNWGWLVALGIAPVLLSLLPCLIMCGLGVGCMKMMGGSGEKPPGQSGNPLSPHYADQFPLWQEGKGLAIAWSEEEVRRAARQTLRLTPAEPAS